MSDLKGGSVSQDSMSNGSGAILRKPSGGGFNSDPLGRRVAVTEPLQKSSVFEFRLTNGPAGLNFNPAGESGGNENCIISLQIN